MADYCPHIRGVVIMRDPAVRHLLPSEDKEVGKGEQREAGERSRKPGYGLERRHEKTRVVHVDGIPTGFVQMVENNCDRWHIFTRIL